MIKSILNIFETIEIDINYIYHEIVENIFNSKDEYRASDTNIVDSIKVLNKYILAKLVMKI